MGKMSVCSGHWLQAKKRLHASSSKFCPRVTPHQARSSTAGSGRHLGLFISIFHVLSLELGLSLPVVLQQLLPLAHSP